MGYYMVVYLAALQGISGDLYEAASIDGATGFKKFRYITLPMLKPTTFFVIIMMTIQCFKVFDLIYVMTGGGPGNATESFGTLMMNEMSAGRYAQSVAVNLVFTLLLVLVSIVYQKFSSRWETVI